MKFCWSYVIALISLSCRPVRPDTITMKDNLSINGSFLAMSDGVIRIKARFPSGDRDARIPVGEVQSIEFNSLTFNPAAPPKILGFGPPAGQHALQKEPPAEGVIVLRGGTRQPCILVGIDADSVRCDPKDIGYPRNTVLRIVLGSE